MQQCYCSVEPAVEPWSREEGEARPRVGLLSRGRRHAASGAEAAAPGDEGRVRSSRRTSKLRLLLRVLHRRRRCLSRAGRAPMVPIGGDPRLRCPASPPPFGTLLLPPPPLSMSLSPLSLSALSLSTRALSLRALSLSVLSPSCTALAAASHCFSLLHPAGFERAAFLQLDDSGEPLSLLILVPRVSSSFGTLLLPPPPLSMSLSLSLCLSLRSLSLSLHSLSLSVLSLSVLSPSCTALAAASHCFSLLHPAVLPFHFISFRFLLSA
eukprot:SAG31_NODE_3920_length_3750_cov_18.007121_4_plen_267_part_00